MVKSKIVPWVVVLSASLFFFYEFIQMNFLSGISDAVMSDLHINATEFGWLSSTYFLANVLFLLVAGILLDRFSTRRLILASLVLCIAGILLFSASHHLFQALAARFLAGIGSAFCFLGVIRLASRWFPARKMAFVTGCIVTMAMSGALLAQTPLIILLQKITWRQSLWVDAGLGVVILGVIAAVVKDFPAGYDIAVYREEQRSLYALGYLRSMKLAFLRGQNWLAGSYGSLMNLIVILLGGTWGKLYLMNAHGLSAMQASYITSLLFIGAIIGGPLVGAISDRVRRRRPPMIIGAMICFLLAAILLGLPIHFHGLLILFLMMGIATSTQIISYPYVAENSPRMITAMSVSVVNISVQSGLFLAEPLFGYLMDLHHNAASTLYAAHDFDWAMLLFPVSFILAMIVAFLLKEDKREAL